MVDTDLEAQGLTCQSYDALFSIRKRVRKINDLTIPTRRGVGTNQIGAFLVTFIASVITYGLIVLPVMNLVGFGPNGWVMVGWVFGLPVLAAQRIAKPMAHGKTISGSLHSLMRWHLDDRVHQRGLPVPAPKRPCDEKVLHYQREWVMSSPHAEDTPGEEDYSDRDTELRIDANVVDLQPWYDSKARAHAAEEQEKAAARDTAEDVKAYYRRGHAATVIGADDDNDDSPDPGRTGNS